MDDFEKLIESFYPMANTPKLQGPVVMEDHLSVVEKEGLVDWEEQEKMEAMEETVGRLEVGEMEEWEQRVEPEL